MYVVRQSASFLYTPSCLQGTTVAIARSAPAVCPTLVYPTTAPIQWDTSASHLAPKVLPNPLCQDLDPESPSAGSSWLVVPPGSSRPALAFRSWRSLETSRLVIGVFFVRIRVSKRDLMLDICPGPIRLIDGIYILIVKKAHMDCSSIRALGSSFFKSSYMNAQKP